MMVEVVSSFFSSEETNKIQESPNDLSDEFLELADEMNEDLNEFKLPPAVKCVYNPSIYARYTFEMYARKYCNTKKKIMFFGMNPGPWGMSQTGVPFGEISSVRDWLGIEGPVNKPPHEIRERPVDGFDCKRTEVSGKRFWGLLKTICGTPVKFFETSFVYNYINQQWMKSNGCNLTPGDFKVSEMEPLYNICDPIFVKILKLYEVEIIVAIGKFCETRAQKAIKKYLPSSSIKILYLSHPSPRSVNNNNWEQKALEELKRHDLLKYYKTN
ncbi:single-strand selective monofunctional uracil DNA glycosylase [Maniola hyperantus]|uniref:single-strand selective monofunctional uracil DNA glycosylase n=1 Tax=Aphantopus hyperantus TaxID=2795564 RepID=UPI0015691F23|nr:single-strand selective monofunctional uracil DNA glycosylase [Maniola hyperantus]